MANHRVQTDDVGVFCSRLSNEYLLIAQAFNLSRGDLIDLCDQAVEAIFGDKHQKQRLWAFVEETRRKWMRTE